MCFSLQADLVAGAALTPIGILALREVRCCARDTLRLAAFTVCPAPIGGGACLGEHADGDVSPEVGHAAAVAYVIFAVPILPTLMPLRRPVAGTAEGTMRVAPFVGLGIDGFGLLTVALLTHPVTVSVHPHALGYGTGVSNGAFWTVLYIVAVIGPSVLSGYPTIVAFGVVNLVGLILVAIVYVEAFASFWCILAGIASVLMLVHMLRRRRLVDDDRMRGVQSPRRRARSVAVHPTS